MSCLPFCFPCFPRSTILRGNPYLGISFAYPNHQNLFFFSVTSFILFPTSIHSLAVSFLTSVLLDFLVILLQKCITVASNSLVLYTSHNYKNSKRSDDLFWLLSFSSTPVHYRIFLCITDNISQSLYSLFKAPTLVKISRLSAGFL